jgi:molybdate transport system ATP-binding protein
MRGESLRASLTARIGGRAIEAEFDTAPGTLALVGPNGAGKSSLLSLLLGVLPVVSGRINIGQSVLLDTHRSIDVPTEWRRLGYVPQDYALFPHLTVRNNIAFALALGPLRRDKERQAARLNSILSELGIEHLAERYPSRLSGGEKQRVALARALSVEPSALLLDEPLAALDVHSRNEVRAFLQDYLAKLALPTVLVTHDARDARCLGDRIAVLESGKVTQVGTWQDLASNPATRFIELFVASADDR